MERLRMQLIHDILFRLRNGQSERAIARDLGHSRVTVHRYHQLARQRGYLDPNRPLPDASQLLADLGPPLAPPATPSTLEPFQPIVEKALAQGIEMVALHRRLVEQHGYTGSYSSVRRFVRRLRPPQPTAFVRVETPPGEQAQIDFSSVGRLHDPHTGEERAAFLFVMTLSYSRHQYLEFVFDQTIATWIACHRRAFESFGGAPRVWVVDNLKAAVLKAALDDPVLSTPYRQMAIHYGALIHPCRPRTPRHKGKVESGVHYAKRNLIAVEEFDDQNDANHKGRRWVAEIAGLRDHGTTHEAPLLRFERDERAALLPLPPEPFRLLEVREAKVHADCHVTLDGSDYSVPYAYVGRRVEVHRYEAFVEVYDGTTLLVTHTRAAKRGERVTRLEHYPPDKALYLERTPDVCRERAQTIGPACAAVVGGLLDDRPLDQLRAAQKLVGLETTYGAARLEAACDRALRFGDPRYRRVKTILQAGMEEQPLPEERPPSMKKDPATARDAGFAHARGSQEFFPIELFPTETPERFAPEASPC